MTLSSLYLSPFAATIFYGITCRKVRTQDRIFDMAHSPAIPSPLNPYQAGASGRQTFATAFAPAAPLEIRQLGISDLSVSLREGIDDFMAKPSHLVFLCLIYPLVGLVMARLISGYQILPLLFPLAAGFALLGPFFALGIYELSRRRELGINSSLSHVFDVMHLPSRGSILLLGGMLLVIYSAWLITALAIYDSFFQDYMPSSIGDFLQEIFSTSRGLSLILVGGGIGFLFAVAVFAVAVVSFPLLLDRNVNAATAISTSVHTVRENPLTMALWGLIIAVALILGSLPFFVGLAVVLPVLGHATWHLYRRAVV